MRFVEKVQFLSSSGKYDPKTGKTAEPKVLGERYANITSLGVNRSIELFGDIQTERLVVRLLNPFNEKWDSLKINNGSKKYVNQTAIRPMKIDGFIVGESYE